MCILLSKELMILNYFNIADECYAVENAKTELKEIATGIIKSNNDDGVALWLKENLHPHFLSNILSKKIQFTNTFDVIYRLYRGRRINLQKFTRHLLFCSFFSNRSIIVIQNSPDALPHIRKHDLCKGFDSFPNTFKQYCAIVSKKALNAIFGCKYAICI